MEKGKKEGMAQNGKGTEGKAWKKKEKVETPWSNNLSLSL